MFETAPTVFPTLLIQPLPQGEYPDRANRLLAELEELATSAGLTVLEGSLLSLGSPSPSLLFGKGQVEELALRVADTEAKVVVINTSLSPTQQRNLERRLKAKVVDRTGLILEIFADRAQTREGLLQVELATLLYQQSRLVRTWTHLERQKGGVGLRGGPGETQIELDRRLIRERIQQLKKSLEQVERTRSIQRRSRDDVPVFVAALVGYTNAGKSTLFNYLTQAGVVAKDQLFATLDSTLRTIPLPGGGAVALCDTVGFIRELPHQLVAAFRATLEEVVRADLLLMVVDLADPEFEEQILAVETVLAELKVLDKPRLTLFNKIDRLPDRAVLERLLARPGTLAISSVSGEGIPLLLQALEHALTSGWKRLQLNIPAADGALLAWLHQQGLILSREEIGEEIRLTLLLPEESMGRLRKRLS